MMMMVMIMSVVLHTAWEVRLDVLFLFVGHDCAG